MRDTITGLILTLTTTATLGCPMDDDTRSGSDTDGAATDTATGGDTGALVTDTDESTTGTGGSDSTGAVGESGMLETSGSSSESGDESTGGDSTGGEVVGAWDCLGAVEAPAFEPGEAQVDFTVVDFPGGTPASDLALRVCDLGDTACETPYAEGITDADGMLSVPVPTDGPTYFEVTGGAAAPTLFFRRGVAPPRDPYAAEIGILSARTLGLFMAVVGTEPIPDRGHLVITGRDCDEALAADVRFEVDTADAESSIAYLVGGIPSVDATATDDAGRGGVLNVPAGPVTITAYLEATDEQIAQREIFIRPGMVSAIGMIPTP